MSYNFSSTDFLHLGHHFAKEEGTTLLYSGGTYASSKMSFLCIRPTEKVIIQLNGKLNPWDVLKSKIDPNRTNCNLPAWVGYLSYEMGAFSDPSNLLPFHSSSIPLALFYKPSIILQFDHKKNTLNIHPKEINLKELLNSKTFPQVTFQAKLIHKESKDEFSKKIELANEHIVNGNIYQVNLSHQLLFDANICPYSYFERVILGNPAPFSAFCNASDFSIICSSPERFLKKSGSILETVPIKGTRPRGKDCHEDLKQIEALKNSSKEFSELLMITDLMRNDLGKVSIPGSIEVKALHHLETYQNVFHQSSHIVSSLKDNTHPIDILRAIFPGGSISGCPKLKALELIYELENRPRHIYTGSIGYITNKGDFDFNIAIRTCLYKDHILDIQLGAGIVFDSDPESEYLETLSKGTTLIGALSCQP